MQPIITERPILFKSDMIRAIQRGDKTQTRRIAFTFKADDYDFTELRGRRAIFNANRSAKRGEILIPTFGVDCKQGEKGDRLWCKETFKTVCGHYVYKADEPRSKADEVDHAFGPWKPSIFMPRTASRITLEITNISVERLQDISREDAISEGVKWCNYQNKEGEFCVKCGARLFKDDSDELPHYPHHSPYVEYQLLWDSINAKRGLGWETNLWVWVIEFKKL